MSGTLEMPSVAQTFSLKRCPQHTRAQGLTPHSPPCAHHPSFTPVCTPRVHTSVWRPGLCWAAGLPGGWLSLLEMTESPQGLGCPHACLVFPEDIICHYPVATGELAPMASELSPLPASLLPPCSSVSQLKKKKL